MSSTRERRSTSHRNRLGGNEGGKELTDVRKKDANGQGIPETHDTDAKGNRLTKTKRVHGIGRWSIVDYEEHLYKKSATKPAVPKPEQLAKLG